MKRVFLSFHYANDNSRVQQIKNMGRIEGQAILSSNEWEQVQRQGDATIKRWINAQMNGRSCVVVLIGSGTANRKWINYEIKKAWKDKKGVLGIYIHNLKDSDGNQAEKGSNPFSKFTINGVSMEEIVKTYNPPYSTSTNVYSHIKENLEDWIEKAIEIRGNYA